jgi:hypothetical protein
LGHAVPFFDYGELDKVINEKQLQNHERYKLLLWAFRRLLKRMVSGDRQSAEVADSQKRRNHEQPRKDSGSVCNSLAYLFGSSG